MKSSTRSIGSTPDSQPGADFYRAAGHDAETAESLAGMDAMCARHAGIATMDRALDRPPASHPLVRRGRAPRMATNTRVHGSRRGTRAESSSSDDPGDPEHPWLRRTDRAPLIWRLSAARSRFLELVERGGR